MVVGHYTNCSLQLPTAINYSETQEIIPCEVPVVLVVIMVGCDGGDVLRMVVEANVVVVAML